jgi:hypothetical protein
MSDLDEHRMAAAENLETFLLKPPFSFFDFVEDSFGDCDSIRRIFSLARSSSAETLVIEQIQPCGIVAEENEDILGLYPSYRNTKLLRLSFWRMPIIAEGISAFASKDLAGYRAAKVSNFVGIPIENALKKLPEYNYCVDIRLLRVISIASIEEVKKRDESTY